MLIVVIMVFQNTMEQPGRIWNLHLEDDMLIEQLVEEILFTISAVTILSKLLKTKS